MKLHSAAAVACGTVQQERRAEERVQCNTVVEEVECCKLFPSFGQGKAVAGHHPDQSYHLLLLSPFACYYPKSKPTRSAKWYHEIIQQERHCLRYQMKE